MAIEMNQTAQTIRKYCSNLTTRSSDQSLLYRRMECSVAEIQFSMSVGRHPKLHLLKGSRQ